MSKRKTTLPVIIRGIKHTPPLKQQQLTKTVKREVNSNERTSDPRMASQAHTHNTSKTTALFKIDVQVEIMPQTESHKKEKKVA